MTVLSTVEMIDKMQSAVKNAQESSRLAKEAAQLAENYAYQIINHINNISFHSNLHTNQITNFIFLLTIFVMSIFVGYFVVWSVTPALHTPLMSVTNAISSVIVIGSIIAININLDVNYYSSILTKSFGFIALILSSINIFGGFLVTNRMLNMYKKNNRSK